VITAQNLHSRYHRRELAMTAGELNINYGPVIIILGYEKNLCKVCVPTICIIRKISDSTPIFGGK
jgi:hypothetical protein